MTTGARAETGGPNRTPRSEITPAVSANRKKEPVLLLDLSTSMDWDATDENNPAGEFPAPASRRAIVAAALPLLVRALAKEDSEAAAEQAGGSDDKGGLLAFGFASDPVEIGDLNESNLQRRLNEIRWGGGTRIMPAWHLALEDYDDEFGDREPGDKPTHLVMVLTDGEAEDFHAFEEVILSANPRRAIAVGILGHGPKAMATYRAYKAAADKQQAQARDGKSHVRVVLFDSVTDPAEVGEDLATLAG